jgi:hypothetical protein
MQSDVDGPLDRRKLKKARKLVEKGNGTVEQIRAIYGANASAGIELLPAALEQPLRLADVQNMVLWALADDRGEMPKWAFVRNKPLLQGALVILARDLRAAEGNLLSAAFTAVQPLHLPRAHRNRLAEAVATEFLQVSLPRKRKLAALAAATEPSRALTGVPTHAGRHASGGWRLEYVRSFAARREELLENGYPMSGDDGTLEMPREFVPYVDASEAGPEPHAVQTTAGSSEGCDHRDEAGAAARLLAFDCEMVLVRGPRMADGGWPLMKQLARVAVVDESGRTLLDELVIPERPVVDYKTQYSGSARLRDESMAPA